MKKYLSIFVFLLIFVGCSDNDEAEVVEYSSDSSKTQKAQTYSLKTIDGNTINVELVDRLLLSKELNGKMVLFNFWATWCPPCRKEMPAFVELQEKYKDKIVIVGVLMEKNKSRIEVQNFLDEYKVNFPITISEEENFRLAKDIANVQKLPESYLYTKEGMFVKQFVGMVSEAELEQYILEAEE